MSVKLIPSITVTTAKQLFQKVEIAQQLSSIVHLDIMDGSFVSTKSVAERWITQVQWRRQVEVHAMVRNLTSLITLIGVLHPRRVYIPIELGNACGPFIAYLRSKKIQVGLALNPSTPLSVVKKFGLHVTSILVLAVQPGRYQAPLHPNTFRRISRLHANWPNIEITVDGSMNATTIPQAIKAGAKRIIIGSAVMLQPDPRRSWRALQRLTNE